MLGYVIEPKPLTKSTDTSMEPATKHFAAVIGEFLNSHGARDTETGRTRRANAKSLYEILQAQRGGKPSHGTSLSNVYRLVRGEASPSIDVVYEIAKAFHVSPHVFLPAEVDDDNE